MKTIWSSRGNIDNILDLTVDQKRLELTNWYDQEMVDQLSDDELDKVIADNVDEFYNEAMEDFEYRVAPMIANQFLGGFVLDENFNLVDPGVLLNDAKYDCEIYEDDNGDLYWKEEGRKAFPILGFAEDQDKFIDQLDKLDILSTMHNLYPGQDDEDIEVYDIADLIPMDWDLLDKVLTHAHNELGVAEESLTEAKAKNPNKLAAEYEEIKDLADEYGYEYFTQMPFTAYDNDPISIEMQYPEFFRIVKAFFKEMDILEGDDINNTDLLDMSWDQDISKHDWDVLMRACEKLSNGKGVQFEKEYKTGYNSVLDDDEILAKREKEESLKEDFYRGVEGVNFIDNGQWADPQLEYNGETFNYWSVENDLWHDFLDETGHTDAEADDPEVEEQFNEYVQNNCISYLDSMLADSDVTVTEDDDAISVFDGEYEVGKTYIPKEDMFMADDFEDVIFSKEEEDEARQLGLIRDDNSLVIPAGTKMVYVGNGGGGWPEFKVGELLDFDVVDSNDDGYVLYPMEESLNEADDNDWPWGNPNSNLPRKNIPEKDSSAIDKFL